MRPEHLGPVGHERLDFSPRALEDSKHGVTILDFHFLKRTFQLLCGEWILGGEEWKQESGRDLGIRVSGLQSDVLSQGSGCSLGYCIHSADQHGSQKRGTWFRIFT